MVYRRQRSQQGIAEEQRRQKSVRTWSIQLACPSFPSLPTVEQSVIFEMKTIIALALLGLLAGALLWERKATTRLGTENELLRAAKLEAERLATENRELPELRRAAAVVPEQSRLAELLRLRNELRQLRLEQREVEKLQAANQRAAEEIKSGQFAPRRLADMEGAVPREKWTFAGFTTPEASVQSFLAAIVSGDMQQLVRCLPSHEAEQLTKAAAEQPEKFRKEFMGGLDQLGKLSAFRITQVRVEDDRAVVDLQLTTDGEPVPLQLYRDDDGWKLRP
jgi:hypothetical protein